MKKNLFSFRFQLHPCNVHIYKLVSVVKKIYVTVWKELIMKINRMSKQRSIYRADKENRSLMDILFNILKLAWRAPEKNKDTHGVLTGLEAVATTKIKIWEGLFMNFPERFRVSGLHEDGIETWDWWIWLSRVSRVVVRFAIFDVVLSLQRWLQQPIHIFSIDILWLLSIGSPSFLKHTCSYTKINYVLCNP